MVTLYLDLIDKASYYYLLAAKLCKKNNPKAQKALEIGIAYQDRADQHLRLLQDHNVARLRAVRGTQSKEQPDLTVDAVIWPDGYFSVSRRIVRLPIVRVKTVSKDAGLNSPPGLVHTLQVKNSQPRGSKGLTRHGARLVRSATAILDRAFFRKCLGFWTCTLPYGRQADLDLVASRASKILNNLRNKLRYHLTKHGLPAWFVGVWEYQSRGALHLHMLLPTKLSRWDKGYLLTIEIMDSLWRDAIESACPELPKSDWKSSCELATIKKSVGGYMAKYLSKSAKGLKDVHAEHHSVKSWYTVSQELREAIESSTERCTVQYNHGRVNFWRILLGLNSDRGLLKTKSGQVLGGIFLLSSKHRGQQSSQIAIDTGKPLCCYGYLRRWAVG